MVKSGISSTGIAVLSTCNGIFISVCLSCFDRVSSEYKTYLAGSPLDLLIQSVQDFVLAHVLKTTILLELPKLIVEREDTSRGDMRGIWHVHRSDGLRTNVVRVISPLGRILGRWLVEEKVDKVRGTDTVLGGTVVDLVVTGFAVVLVEIGKAVNDISDDAAGKTNTKLEKRSTKNVSNNITLLNRDASAKERSESSKTVPDAVGPVWLVLRSRSSWCRSLRSWSWSWAGITLLWLGSWGLSLSFITIKTVDIRTDGAGVSCDGFWVAVAEGASVTSGSRSPEVAVWARVEWQERCVDILVASSIIPIGTLALLHRLDVAVRVQRLPDSKDTVNVAVMKPESRVECSNWDNSHSTVVTAADSTVDLVMDRFERIIGSRSCVGLPGGNTNLAEGSLTGQKIVKTFFDLRLLTVKTVDQQIILRAGIWSSGSWPSESLWPGNVLLIIRICFWT